MPVLVQALPSGPLDIVGDIHGEHEALLSLLGRLGCDPDRATVERPLVFIGDLIDRGPDSPAVVETVMRLVAAGVAQCIVGNHELNLMLGLKKEGNGWARNDATDGFQLEVDGTPTHRPFGSEMASAEQTRRFLAFFATLPLALTRDDLRVVHACWHAPGLERLPESGDVTELGRRWAREIQAELTARGVATIEREEFEEFARLKRLDTRPTRDLPAHGEAAEARQSRHPIKVLTSGPEERIPFGDVFFVGGKWRFVQRYDWWNHYDEEPAVVVGHYWRRRKDALVAGKPDSWRTSHFTDWTGPRRNVFCIDYSVGRRYLDRFRGQTDGFEGGLAALRWPERQLVFDDDPGLPTTEWGGA